MRQAGPRGGLHVPGCGPAGLAGRARAPARAPGRRRGGRRRRARGALRLRAAPQRSWTQCVDGVEGGRKRVPDTLLTKTVFGARRGAQEEPDRVRAGVWYDVHDLDAALRARKPRNPQHFDGIEGGRKRISDTFTRKTVVHAYGV